MDAPGVMAARGDLIYLASPHFDKKLHLLVINRNEPDKAVADVTVEPLNRDEDIIPDGIAITEDMVFLTTTEGRILAFDAK